MDIGPLYGAGARASEFVPRDGHVPPTPDWKTYEAINDALGTDVKPTFFHEIGRETLRLEREFNLAAGFTAEDDDLPEFFYNEPLKPTDDIARFRGEEVFDIWDHMNAVGTAGVPEEYGTVRE